MTDAVPRRPDGRPLWYGRRASHKLRPGRQRLVDDLLPTIRVPSEGPSEGAIDLAALFGRSMPAYRLEIGFGGGEHLAGQAAANPDVGFIGSEPFINGVASLLAEIDERALANVRVFDDDVRLILDKLPAAAFERIYVLFPDPWPKTRHHRRRIVGAETLGQLARLVPPGGQLLFATDHMGYAAWALEHVRRHPAWRWTAERPGDWRDPPADWVPTRYEKKARRKGDLPVYLSFERQED